MNKNDRLKVALKEHEKFLRRVGYIAGSSKGRTMAFDSINLGSSPSPASNLPPLTNNIPVGGGFKRSIEDFRWKTGLSEKLETINAIEKKKKMIAPIYNKGALQYIGENADLTTLGKKI